MLDNILAYLKSCEFSSLGRDDLAKFLEKYSLKGIEDYEVIGDIYMAVIDLGEVEALKQYKIAFINSIQLSFDMDKVREGMKLRVKNYSEWVDRCRNEYFDTESEYYTSDEVECINNLYVFGAPYVPGDEMKGLVQSTYFKEVMKNVYGEDEEF